MKELSSRQRWIVVAVAAVSVWFVVSNWPHSLSADESAAKQSCQDFDALEAGTPINAPVDRNAKLVSDGIQQAETAAAKNSLKWQQLYTDWQAVEEAHGNPTELSAGWEGIRSICNTAGYV